VNRIDKVFGQLRQEGKKVLIPYVSCGDPHLKFTEELVLGLAENGADLIELGVPYSDPVADGPTIQKASTRALAEGVTLEKIFSLVERLREKTSIPLIMMTYYNPVYVKGVENFLKRAGEAGIDGLIIPDLPVEESENLKDVAENYGLNLIFLVAPTSTPERIKKIVNMARGFIYCVSVTGITGARKELGGELASFLKVVQAHTSLPLAVGFGISGPDMARKAAGLADGIIVGSALIERIEKNIEHNGFNYGKALEEAITFVGDLKTAITIY
jgi:tryptophan synthase alpha chain